MQTTLSVQMRGRPEAEEGAAILRSCVHCGFCTATCPTYQLLGDELDGPRGRIHLIKQLLEGDVATQSTQLHLDRCLTCRACETSCPSGVQYGHLVDIGRKLIDEQVERPVMERLRRRLLAAWLTGPLFGPSLRAGQWLRPLLPKVLASMIPAKRRTGMWPTRSARSTGARRVLMLAGCVQPALAPNINSATARVLDALGIAVVIAPSAGCCGAIRHHLGDQSRALEEARRNIDAWWPHVESGADAILSSASGCGTQLREYGHLLRGDPAYAQKAARVSAMTRDLAELLPQYLDVLRSRMRLSAGQRVAFHAPCSLQHGLQVRGAVEHMLSNLGAELVPVADGHLCCGSAGTYSLLQSGIAEQLGRAKVAALTASKPEVILSANIGCIGQIARGTSVPLQHWIEWVDERMQY